MSVGMGWLGLLVLGLAAGCGGQSTTSRPQSQCASYLNRYTQENQCIYSFIVPKKDSDHCPGLEDQIRSLQAIVQEIQLRQNRTDEQIRNINKNEENLRRIGRLEAEIAKLTREKATSKDEYEDLLALSKEHETEKARLTIQLTNAEDALRGARGRLVPLERNHTDLEGDFIRVRDDLANLRSEHNNLKTAYAALHKTKNCSDVNKHLPSCAVIKEWGYTRSGDAMIDPDGEGGVDPFLVYCDMDSDPSTGITVVKTDHADDSPVSGCEESGCFTQLIVYKGASVEQISKLVDISLACEQGLKYRCYDSKLLRDDTGWWVSRNGSKQTYWGGAPPGSNKCACGVTGTCFDRTEVCNCDADAEQWLEDEGMLLDKDSLPVTALRFGDVSVRSNEKGNYTLGPLRCKWNVNQSVPSCNALQQAGVTKSGTFLVDPDGPKGPQMALLTHCNLATGSNSSVGSQGPRGDPNMYVFSDCGKEPGRFGPDQDACNKSYFGGNVYVRVVEGVQLWRIPRDGRYRITAYAPSGHHSTPALAGRGAIANAEFKLPEGTQMKVLVGQQGLRTSGSGGTFVIRVEKTYTDIPYVIAGAGGSSTGTTAAYSATDASVTADGKKALRWAANIGNGGIDGNGGDRGNRLSGENTPGGGAGFKTDGTPSGDQRFGKPEAAKAAKGSGKGKEAPGVGGSYSYLSTKYDGGFGGGGSGTKNGPGGAGGYSGGGGGSSDGHSGGGGSFVHSDAINRNLEAANRGRGRVTIEYLGPAPELSA